MSFSLETKTELCRAPVTRSCCALAEIYGALLLGGAFSHREIRLSTEHAVVARRLSMLISRAFFVDTPAVRVGRKYVLRITDERSLRRILSTLGYDFKCHVSYHLNRNMVENDCCAAAFLRGIFLIGGTVASPDKKCHLELKSAHRSLCREIMSLMLDMGLSPKFAERSSAALLYFKDTARVEDFLTLLGASRAALRIMEAKVEKEIRNTVNRQVNCETANIVKVADASARQVAAISRVLAWGGEHAFPEALRETVRLRLANPTASLSELAELFDPPISKPGLSHRMRKILALAERIAPEETQ